MAVTWAATSIVEDVSSNGKRAKRCVLTPTGTYTITTGDALPFAALGLKGVTNLYVDATGTVLTQPGFSVLLSGTAEAPTIRLFETNNTEVVNATSITGRAFVARVEGF